MPPISVKNVLKREKNELGTHKRAEYCLSTDQTLDIENRFSALQICRCDHFGVLLTCIAKPQKRSAAFAVSETTQREPRSGLTVRFDSQTHKIAALIYILAVLNTEVPRLGTIHN